MTIVEALKLADKLEGAYIDLGFGSGNDAKEVFNYMLYNQIKKRDIVLIDQFLGSNKGIWQKAFDLSNEAKNRLKVNGQYFTLDINKDSFNSIPKGAIVTIDLEEATYFGVKKVLPLLQKGAIVIIKNYNSIQEDVNRALIDLETSSKVFTSDNFSYIVVGDIVKKVQSTKISRTRSVLT